MFQNFLGVAPTGKALCFVILSPVGPYYRSGMFSLLHNQRSYCNYLIVVCCVSLGWKPVRLIADTKFVRAWPGGTGNSKVGGYSGHPNSCCQ